jgi:hypothetical protein
MFNFKSHGEEIGNYLVLDIRSSSVGLGVIQYKKNSKPKVIYSDRRYIYFEEKSDSDNFVKRFMEEIDKILVNFENNGLKDAKINKAFVLYSSPWYISKTREVTISKKEPFTFTKEIFNVIINDEKTADPQKDSRLKIIERDVTDILVNGYKLAEPFGKKVEDLKIVFFTGAIAKDTHKNIEDKIKEKFNVEDIQHRTHSFVLFTTIRNLFINVDNFAFFDVGGEITDFGHVENDILKKSIGIPFGKHHFIREVGGKCKFDRHTALSLMKITATGQADHRCGPNTQEVIESIEEQWYETLNQTVKENIPTKILPENIFVTSDEDVSDYINHVFKKRQSDELSSISSKNQKLISVNNNLFKDYVSYKEGISKDIYMSLVATFLSDTISSVEYKK